jgi:hypothetical protein
MFINRTTQSESASKHDVHKALHIMWKRIQSLNKLEKYLRCRCKRKQWFSPHKISDEKTSIFHQKKVAFIH